MKIGELITNYNKMSEVAKKDKLFQPKLNYALAKNILTMEQEVKIYTQNRNDIIRKFALIGEDGNPVVKKEKYVFETNEKQNQFIEAMEELDGNEIIIDIRKVPYEVVETVDEKYDQLTAADLMALDSMVEE